MIWVLLSFWFLRLCGLAGARRRCSLPGNSEFSASLGGATPKGARLAVAILRSPIPGNATDCLVRDSSDVSIASKFIEMSMDKGVMKMRHVASGIEIKPGQTIRVQTSGYHLMFVGLKNPLKQGEHVKATLAFEKAGNASVDFVVKSIGARIGGSAPGGMPMQHGH